MTSQYSKLKNAGYAQAPLYASCAADSKEGDCATELNEKSGERRHRTPLSRQTAS